ncbi:MAG: DUF2779 domain-containing protein [Flavobacteriales bacterium]|nr:DUF2779 domain-containing protein [Flavobacteriales bacterium]
MHLLSKSTYMRGKQCPKALWLYKHRPELRPVVSEAQQAIFDNGTAVGLLAQQRFPGGVDCTPEDHYDYGPALAATQAAMAAGAAVIYEAAFQHDGVLAALDILVRDGDGWIAVEVKSATSVKEQFVADAALQYQVITASGVRVKAMHIMVIDTSYVRQGAIDPQRLFKLVDVTTQVRNVQAEVAERIVQLKAVVQAAEEPVVGIGPHCKSPYTCDFKGHCWAHIPPTGSVLDLTNAQGKEWELYARGILLMADIPANEPLYTGQQRQVNGWRTGQHIVDQGAIREWLADMRYPLHHFDFETVMPAVPLYDGTHPYQQLPFQYSVHVQHTSGAEPMHFEHLGDGHGDPREALVEQLLQDIGPEGDILAYNAPFERSCLHGLARDFPQHAPALLALAARIKDLQTPFKKGWYYAPAMDGRSSIKVVLPALVPDMSYAGLEVQEGMAASRLFEALLSGAFTGDVEQVRRDLLAYCGMDTLAMVKVLEVLEGV